MIKVLCKECEVKILPATAKKTGGLCIPCKNGTRKSIEESKKYYAEQRNYNPYRALWTSLVKRTHAENGGFDEEGFAHLTVDERLFYAVSILELEVYNGGMYQFFDNTSGVVIDEVVAGLKKLGAETVLNLLFTATRILFGNATPQRDHLGRWDALPMCPDDDSDPEPQWSIDLEVVNRAFCKDPDHLGDRLSRFATEKGLVQPFIKEGEV